MNKELFDKLYDLMLYLLREKVTFSRPPCNVGTMSREDLKAIILEKIGSGYDYVVYNQTYIIVDKESHNSIMTIETKYDGDFRGGWEVFDTPFLYSIDYIWYFMGTKLEYPPQDSIWYILDRGRTKAFYALSKNMLQKYDLDGKLLWSTKTSILSCVELTMHDRPDDSFPIDLLCIKNLLTNEYYRSEDGQFYDRLHIRYSHKYSWRTDKLVID